ncbi:SRPBCC domain-containing protein [Loktanella agnita]|uniref:SRPBCC domain-containing protein n=1 Tax=Loktanella agnita TaxID=287097 RepID=UPI00398A02F4
MTKLSLTLEGDTHVIVTREFSATPELVYRAHTDPELVKKWLYGPDGWVMTQCTYEAWPGGKIRLDWEDANGENGFYLTGEFIALTPNERTEHVERMHVPDATPDTHCVTSFAAKSGGTLLTLRMTVADAESRAAMLETGVEEGMEASYARIDPMFAEA